MLKQRRLKKQERDQQIAQQNIQAQAQANAETAEKAAMAEVQKNQALAQSTLQIEQGKSQLRIQEMQTKGEPAGELEFNAFVRIIDKIDPSYKD